jgi:hypothetical protein
MALADPTELAIGVHLAAYRAASMNLRLTQSAVPLPTKSDLPSTAAMLSPPRAQEN